MRVKLEWLNELVDLTGLSLKEIVDKASLYSIEIENVDRMVNATGLVVGHVLTKEKHPDSDHLNCLTVDVGDEILNVVCGAPNVEKGQYVILAKIGAKLPGGEIKRSKIRGVESEGMCCSLQELGIENKYIDEKFANGIYYFEDSVTVGMDAKKALNWDDEILELGITPNRGDLLSMLGVAYEFSASFNRPMKEIAFELKRKLDAKIKNINVKIETKNCIGYYGQLIRNVHIDKSPRWLSSRVIAFGMRSINNAVDITNYILALYGQPLHAFDYDKMGNNIVIKDANENEKFVTLDGIERTLTSKDIVITNGKESLCLGGVMGGLNSEITDETKNIMLEAAVFDPQTIRQTATRLSLHSEASNRYERGVDINRTKLALDHACLLFKELCDADIINEPGCDGTLNIADKEIDITSAQINKVLGTNIDDLEVIDIFNRLKFKVNKDKNTLKVFVPNRRPDITIKEDLIEEVARLHGYEQLPLTLPCDSMAGELTISNKNKRLIMDTLTGLGLHQVITYSLVNQKQNSTFRILNDDIEPIKVLMPLTEEREQLRYSLIPSLIEVVKYNLSRKVKNISDFEISKVYYMKNGERKEETHLGLCLTNEYSNTLWQGKLEKVDFYLVKGILNQLFKKLDLDISYVLLDKECKEMHPNRSALMYLGDELIGYVGQVHPEFAHYNDLDDVYVAEINLSNIINSKKEIKKYHPIQKLPSIERDLALVMKKEVLASDLINCIKKSDKQYLTDVFIFDLYEGEHMASGEKSIAVKLVFTSNEQITEDVIEAKIKRILKDLEYKLNVHLRS